MEQYQLAILVILIVLVLYFYYDTERLTNRPDYFGHPLVDSIDDSGADLRILGTQFSSTDQ